MSKVSQNRVLVAGVLFLVVGLLALASSRSFGRADDDPLTVDADPPERLQREVPPPIDNDGHFASSSRRAGRVTPRSVRSKRSYSERAVVLLARHLGQRPRREADLHEPQRPLTELLGPVIVRVIGTADW